MKGKKRRNTSVKVGLIDDRSAERRGWKKREETKAKRPFIRAGLK
jgi:hypothetical protein